MHDPDRLILLGEIGSAHGIRGEVAIRTFTEDPADIAAYGALSDKTGNRTFVIASVRVTSKAVIAKIKGIDDRTAAEKLRNIKLYIKRACLPEPEAGAFYYEDLTGLKALDTTGAELGTVAGVVNFGAGDLLEVSRPGERETLLVPFTLDAVPKVDLASGTVSVVPPAFTDATEKQSADDAPRDEE